WFWCVNHWGLFIKWWFCCINEVGVLLCVERWYGFKVVIFVDILHKQAEIVRNSKKPQAN
ncbi:hypothetical protein COC46_01795, partial [Bacillus sp. AFS041924]